MSLKDGCNSWAWGDYNWAPLDVDRFSQKWIVKKQPSGNYTITSECQPTQMLHNTGLNSYMDFGTAGQVGAWGSWDMHYNYDQPHAADAEWTIEKTGPNSFTLWHPDFAAYIPVHFSVTN